MQVLCPRLKLIDQIGLQIYVGLVIGVLSVTVLLLLVTILVMMRRNKQKIFNKHAAMMFKTPLTAADRHMMRDLTPLNHSAAISSNAKNVYGESDHEESSSIYHEPYRLVLQRNNYRNSSCGRLCDYEDLGLLGSEQVPISVFGRKSFRRNLKSTIVLEIARKKLHTRHYP
jgi:hypothetical protein